jgi:hypothetical protein
MSGSELDKIKMRSEEKVYCEDCRHCTRPDCGDSLRNLEYSRCAIAAPVTGLPFVGRAFNKPPFCSTARMDGQPCGPWGNLFEARET